MLESKDECTYASQHLNLEDTDALEYDYKSSKVSYGCLYNTNGGLYWYPPSESRYNSASCGGSAWKWRALKYYCICRKGTFKRV